MVKGPNDNRSEKNRSRGDMDPEYITTIVMDEGSLLSKPAGPSTFICFLSNDTVNMKIKWEVLYLYRYMYYVGEKPIVAFSLDLQQSPPLSGSTYW